MKKTLIPSAIVGLLLANSLAYSAELSPMQQKVKAVMKMEHREEADTKRDRNRNPVHALEFFGLKQDMKVIEFAPGNGWYTKILGPVLNNQGELHLAYKKEWLNEMDKLLSLKDFSKTKKLPIELEWNGKDRRYQLGKLSFGITDADMFLNIREYHNFNPKDKAKLNKAAFDSLKKGGIYVVVDHSRRPMAPETFELRRREDPVKAILDIQAAGFVLEKSSDMFYRPDDELRYEVGRRTIKGNTDRFTLIFRKPK